MSTIIMGFLFAIGAVVGLIVLCFIGAIISEMLG